MTHRRLHQSGLKRNFARRIEKAVDASRQRNKVGQPGPLMVNAYQCTRCRAFLVTVHRHRGTTPMYVNCLATPGCTGQAMSTFYSATELEPTAEWYAPEAGEIRKLNYRMREHVELGGLLIREIQPDLLHNLRHARAITRALAASITRAPAASKGET